MLPVWILKPRSAPRTFQRHSEIRLLFLRILMLLQQRFVVVIQGEHLRSMERRLTIAGWCLTALTSSGNIVATLMSSGLHPSKPSSTFTSTSTRA
jgi:hypothetical protein